MPIHFKVNKIMQPEPPGPDLSKGGSVFFYEHAPTGLMFKPVGGDPVPINNVKGCQFTMDSAAFGMLTGEFYQEMKKAT